MWTSEYTLVYIFSLFLSPCLSEDFDSGIQRVDLRIYPCVYIQSFSKSLSLSKSLCILLRDTKGYRTIRVVVEIYPCV